MRNQLAIGDLNGAGRFSHAGHSHVVNISAGLNHESDHSATSGLVSDSLTVTTGRGSVRRSVSTLQPAVGVGIDYA